MADSFKQILLELSNEIQSLVQAGKAPSDEHIRMAQEAVRLAAATDEERRELALLYEVAGLMASSFQLSELLHMIIERATGLVGAERGYVVLVNDQGERDIAAARHFDPENPDDAYSTSLVCKVIESGAPILTTNVQDDGRFELSQSIISQQIRSVLAVPLTALGQCLGAIYVDTLISERFFGEPDLHLLQAMSSQAALAIRNARLYQDAVDSNERLQAAMQELKETQEQLVQAERLAAVGRLSASVAHELRNPLMVMRASLFFLERLVEKEEDFSSELFGRYIQKIDSEIDRQNKIINDLLFFSRNRPRQMDRTDVNDLLSETLARVQRPETVVVETSFSPEGTMVLADGDQIQQVFINLVTNAVQAMAEGGKLLITTCCEEGEVKATVADTGVGISPENLQSLFEPFFTTKENGIGLGLSVCKSIVEAHGGTIKVASELGIGTQFTISLPCVDSQC